LAHALVNPGSAPPDLGALGEARTSAMQAVGTLNAPSQGGGAPAAGGGSDLALAYASSQLGEVLTFQTFQREDGPAAETFDRAAELNPSFAYAYYYAGMSYREVSRIDLMAIRFERFLELAPEAPERTRGQAIIRTVRGR
jgi:tetratricopeptide (TPR) repeat protein